ncbi:hypothetical protein BBO99_00009007 [Phytophthora kernoviae]|uniref:Uncharacterized protein n=2 Tax=Phytophthora kernoviae TaxID=325452 RepID=A0A3R7GR18_9STRA|nr:hypothetical protein G195_011366 [Phytophthora kernoviae 00238/432]KAG2502421.1 hypothetical protein JM16_009813 [Phytophthora kernoviae]KAG2509580.1 hypothetical protein JM18_008902 [Phytophthora kernoviae]RLN11149.1 hypothetical protein BBI17_009008 [Phytophthora kernoviae]RLN74292.1 hypothetical protein BBO99_00009007 [Phytophthora kernoviae]
MELRGPEIHTLREWIRDNSGIFAWNDYPSWKSAVFNFSGRECSFLRRPLAFSSRPELCSTVISAFPTEGGRDLP